MLKLYLLLYLAFFTCTAQNKTLKQGKESVIARNIKTPNNLSINVFAANVRNSVSMPSIFTNVPSGSAYCQMEHMR